MEELERTFLVKFVPDLSGCESKEVVDIYVPKTREHATLRIRKNGSSYEITKKEPARDNPAVMNEETVRITKDEFEALANTDGKRLHKIRYFYAKDGLDAQIGVFKGDLNGLVLADFEFGDEASMNSFKAPDFCLLEVTDEDFLAGGMLCGKSYKDIESRLEAMGYKRLVD
ncbi:MAG: hypothetical protein KGI04_04780 [Candidatus Micrarchaeota archaeon]|nr:hypothetical protein [Candidatus Micrarchaeota archaeon]